VIINICHQTGASSVVQVWSGRKRMAETYKGTAYCVKCKEKHDFEGTISVSDSGRRTAKGVCPVCGTKISTFLKKA